MPTSLYDLHPHAQSLAVESLRWSEQWWDAPSSLLDVGFEGKPIVRDSCWFALGLLLRNGKGDVERARAIIDAVLATQFDEPGAAYHGTFPRWIGEPRPPAESPQMWRDYDPNWRQFIGTTLALILDEYGERLEATQIERIDRAIRLAVEGEPPERCPASYTNIALMKAALLTWAGKRYGEAGWVAYGEEFGQAVYDLFQRTGAYDEYNSPTYYGVNLYALAFWRRYARSAKLAKMGGAMEAALWRDIARYYHAGLRNICGPYTRSYGMDMPHYGALLGLSIWLGVGREDAPFPTDAGVFDHCHDFIFGPAFALSGTRIPADVLPHFRHFSGERSIQQPITTEPQRVATAWLGDDLMIGAESTPLDDYAFFKPSDQFHPATIHWYTPGGGVAWLRLRHIGPVNAQAAPNSLTISGTVEPSLRERFGVAHSEWVYEIFLSEGADGVQVGADRWELPGLTVTISTDLAEMRTESAANHLRLIYPVNDDRRLVTFAFTLRKEQNADRTDWADSSG